MFTSTSAKMQWWMVLVVRLPKHSSSPSKAVTVNFPVHVAAPSCYFRENQAQNC